MSLETIPDISLDEIETIIEDTIADGGVIVRNIYDVSKNTYTLVVQKDYS